MRAFGPGSGADDRVWLNSSLNVLGGAGQMCVSMSDTPAQNIDPTSAELAGRVIGGCRLETLLGVGGMGAVWRAHHLGLDIPVALKLMLPIQDIDPNAGQRLLREARAAAKLRHPHIVGVLNVGEEAGVQFLVMELIDGQSLQRLLDQRGTLPVSEAVGLVLQILEALEVTFEHRFVHRDIKPDNILIDARGVAKLADLGLAKQAGGDLNLTQTGVVMGSPFYIAPEQAANSKTADSRADLYALGCVLFHLLVGAPPYGGSTHLEVILNHIRAPLPDLSRLHPRLPVGLDEVVLRLLAKAPEDRYQTPQEARAALAPYAAGGDGVARTRPPAFGRRTRVLVLVCVPALVLLLAVLLLRSRPVAAPPAVLATATTTAVASAPNVDAVREERPPSRRREASHPRTAPSAPSSPAPATPPRPGPEPILEWAGNALSEAVAGHDTQRLRRLLDRGTPPNVGDGVTSPLHLAVVTGQPQSVRLLLEKGANPNARDTAGETPLHLALRRMDRTSVAALLDFGANPNLRDRWGRSPLVLANGDPFLLQKLNEKGANP
jgi:hypothetical protein